MRESILCILFAAMLLDVCSANAGDFSRSEYSVDDTPVHLATGVPLNPVIFISDCFTRCHPGMDGLERCGCTAEVAVLVDTDGNEIATALEPIYEDVWVSWYRPVSQLQPNTEYEVWWGDEEPTSMMWTFTTGNGMDQTAETLVDAQITYGPDSTYIDFGSGGADAVVAVVNVPIDHGTLTKITSVEGAFVALGASDFRKCGDVRIEMYDAAANLSKATIDLAECEPDGAGCSTMPRRDSENLMGLLIEALF